MKLEVSTHDNEIYIVTVDEYDADTLNKDLNDDSLNTVAIGNIVISRINLKLVKPYAILDV